MKCAGTVCHSSRGLGLAMNSGRQAVIRSASRRGSSCSTRADTEAKRDLLLIRGNGFAQSLNSGGSLITDNLLGL